MQRISLLLPILGAALTFAQAPPQAAQSPTPEKPASVSGEVRNSVTGMPVERAHVSLKATANNASGHYGGITDATGKFTIGGISPGEYSISLDRVGYVAPADVARTRLTLATDEKKENYKLKLTPVGTISGTVTGSDGLPIEGLSVRAYLGGEAQQSGSTDDRGQYRIGGLTPGKYRVRAEVKQPAIPPEIRTDGTAEIHYASTFYPDQVELTAARRVAVGPAIDVAGIDIRLVQTPIVRVAGKVVGQPQGAKNMGLGITNGYLHQGFPAKPDGTFEIWRLDPGQYSFAANFSDGGISMRSAPLKVDVAQDDVENVELRVLPAEDIHGQIAFDDEGARPQQASPPTQSPSSQPASQLQSASQPSTKTASSSRSPGQPQSASQPTSQSTSQPQQPQAQQAASPTRVSLRDAVRGYELNRANVNDDGTFVLPKVQPGTYVLRVSGYPAYVKSVKVGRTESSSSELDLAYGANGAAITVTLASTFGSVTGVVSDDQGPVARARVIIVDPLKRSQFATTASDVNGNFKFERVAPSNYKMVAVDDLNEIDVIRQAQNLDDYNDRLEPVEVLPSGTVSHDLKMPVAK